LHSKSEQQVVQPAGVGWVTALISHELKIRRIGDTRNPGPVWAHFADVKNATRANCGIISQ